MAEEYVRKSDVVKVLTNNRVHFNDMVKITSEIKALETIKVEKQKPGKWIEICPMVVDGGLAKRIKCSECGDERLDYFISKHYCPNCGAKMEGGERMSLTLSIIALIVSVVSLVLAMWQFVPLIKRYMLRRKIMRLKKSIYGTHSNFLVIDEFLTADGEKKEKDD